MSDELARRIAAAARESRGRGLDARSWLWLFVLGAALPAALLVWGWPP
jgi:hypothetical protein